MSKLASWAGSQAYKCGEISYLIRSGSGRPFTLYLRPKGKLEPGKNHPTLKLGDFTCLGDAEAEARALSWQHREDWRWGTLDENGKLLVPRLRASAPTSAEEE